MHWQYPSLIDTVNKGFEAVFIDLILSSIISPKDCSSIESITMFDSYINYNLKERYRPEKPSVKFGGNIPKGYHDHIIREAGKAGWSVLIEKVPGFYEWEESYNFIFTPM